MQIDIFSDIICPWCLIGKRRLERALLERPQPGLTLRWRAFQLNPDMPHDGMDRAAYLAAKFGHAKADQIYRTIRQVGEAEGIAFRFEKITRTPNTVDAHRLVRLAGIVGQQDAMVEALFQAYFLNGANLSDAAALAEIAAGAGMDKAEAAEFLASPAHVEDVQAESAFATKVGITGVPCFIANGQYAISGAQEPEGLFPLFDLARQEPASQPAA
ncbi:MAG: DsbA family oxidoreductase [Alphaproteobacteria bacterium]|nr:DsbA family oxidoreductase [Alphaproteobacteria bacterium]